jgi:hypothetical protein
LETKKKKNPLRTLTADSSHQKKESMSSKASHLKLHCQETKEKKSEAGQWDLSDII